jgi:hypothetical protein
MEYGDEYAVSASMFDTPRAAAGIVLGALLALFLIRRGFRGVSVSAAIK